MTRFIAWVFRAAINRAYLWLTAAIGVAAELGRKATAVLSTLLTLTILYPMPKFSGGSDRG